MSKLDIRKIPASSEIFRPAKTDFSVVDVPTGTSPPDKIGFNSAKSSSDRDEVLRKPSKKVIVFVGMPGAGKSMAVDYLKSKGLPSYYMGGIVTIDEMQKRGLDLNEQNEKIIREDLRAKEGMGVMAKRTIPKLEEFFANGHETAVADGLYSWSEYKIFKEKYGDNAIIIAISAPRKLRHERLANRPHRPLADVEVSTREYAEIENIEKGGPIANADYTILNNSTPKFLIDQIDQVLAQESIII